MKTKILTVFLFSISVFVFSQHKFMKYPEFNKSELSKTKSTIKEDAHAEILYSSISNLIINGQLETKVFKRIKIYNKEKSSQYLDVEIPLYEGNGEKESVSGLKAVTYNLDNDKVVTSKVEKDAKFKSKEQKNQVIQKFTFPNVKDGSIIEYQYQLNSPFLQLLDKTYLEFDIPVIYEEYIFDFPKFFGYNYNFQGGLMPKYKEDQAQMMYGQDYYSLRLGFENVPPFKAENFVKNDRNYITNIRPELNSTNFNNTFKSYATTWDDVRDKLKDYDDFGGQLSKKSLARNVLSQDIMNIPIPKEKASKILKFVQSTYTWDGNVGLFTGDGIKSLIDSKIGNSAEINLYLIMLMREAGLNVSPMIMNTVNRGILNIAFPTIGAPNYVVACLEDNGNYYLYDATSKFSLPNLLPPRAYNYNAILLKDKKAEILQINNFIESKTYLNVDAKLNEDTTFEGNFKDRDTKTFAILAYDEYVDNKQDYEKKYKERYTFNFNNYKSEVVNDNEFQTSFDFNTDGFVDGVGGKLIFNPLLFLFRQNHEFNQIEERKYPIEFLSPYETVKKVTITIPDNYKFENLPKSKKFKTEDEGIVYSYVVSTEGNKITVETSVKIDSDNYPREYYPAFKQIFDAITQLEGQLVTLVKK